MRTGVWNEQALHWPGSTCSGLASAAVGEHMFVFRGKGPFDLDNALDVQVSVMNLDANFGSSEFKWTHVRCTVDGDGRFPCARSMHTASTCGDRVFVFGGVTRLVTTWTNCGNTFRRRLRGDNSRARDTREAVTRRHPSMIGTCWFVAVRSEMNCTIARRSTCRRPRDVWKTVACAADRREDAPCRRAMHAAAIFGNKWIIVGGGDNEKPVCDAHWLDVRKWWTKTSAAWERCATRSS